MHHAFKNALDIFLVVYLDGIMVFSIDLEEYEQYVM